MHFLLHAGMFMVASPSMPSIFIKIAASAEVIEIEMAKKNAKENITRVFFVIKLLLLLKKEVLLKLKNIACNTTPYFEF